MLNVKANLFLGELDTPLSDTVQQALQDARKISVLYKHQALSINALVQGKNVIVSTSTASGKSVIYQVIILCQRNRVLAYALNSSGTLANFP